MGSVKEKFLRSYSNLLEEVRKEIVVVIDGEPFTWSSAYFEVKNDTETGKKILRELEEFGVI